MNVRGSVWAVATSLVLAACASEPMAAPAGFDSSAGKVVVTVLGDGFVRLDAERMPLDAAVLRLRFHARSLSAEELQRFVVKVVVAPGLADAALVRAGDDLNRLVHELDVMEVGQGEIF